MHWRSGGKVPSRLQTLRKLLPLGESCVSFSNTFPTFFQVICTICLAGRLLRLMPRAMPLRFKGISSRPCCKFVFCCCECFLIRCLVFTLTRLFSLKAPSLTAWATWTSLPSKLLPKVLVVYPFVFLYLLYPVHYHQHHQHYLLYYLLQCLITRNFAFLDNQSSLLLLFCCEPELV